MKYFFLILCLVSTTPIFAQTLPRAGHLGVQLAPTDNPSTACVLRSIAPGGTADEMGLEVEDEITAINGEEVTDFNTAVATLRAYTAGTTLQLTVDRRGRKETFSGVLQALELPTPPGSSIHYSAVPFQQGQLRSIIQKPAGKGPFPAVFFIQGYTCGSVAYGHPAHPLGRLFSQLVEKGYLVYRVEKPGVGESAGTPDCMEIDFPTEVEAFRAAYKDFWQQPDIDKTKTFIYGHSLGGITAPLVIGDQPPAGIMVYGTGLYSWHDYMIELARDQFPRMGEDYAAVEASLQQGRHLLFQYFKEGKDPRIFLKSEKEKELFSKLVLGYDGQTTVTNRHFTFWQTLDSVNLVRAWKQVPCPVLSMYGEFDLAALDADAMQGIANIVNHYHPGHGTFILIPGTDHGLARVKSKEHKLKLQSTGQYWPHLQAHFNVDYAEVLHEWMMEIMLP